MGKRIICPHCNSEQTVYHFSWSDLMCTKCKEMVDKYDWWVSTNPTKFSKRLTLCDPKVKCYVEERFSSSTRDSSDKVINSHF